MNVLVHAALTERARALFLPGLFGGCNQFFDVLGGPALAEAGVTAITTAPAGFANNPANGHPLTVEAYADSVEKLAADQSVSVLVGYSYFANVVLELVATRRWRGPAVLVSPSLSRKCEMRILRALDKLMRNGFIGRKLMPRIIEQVAQDTMKVAPDRAGACAAETRSNVPADALAVMHRFFDYLDELGDRTDALAATDSPLWYVRGDHDEIRFPAASREKLVARPNLTLVEVAGAKHTLPFTHGGELAKVVVTAATR